jgi:hypothetical protein
MGLDLVSRVQSDSVAVILSLGQAHNSVLFPSGSGAVCALSPLLPFPFLRLLPAKKPATAPAAAMTAGQIYLAFLVSRIAACFVQKKIGIALSP